MTDHDDFPPAPLNSDDLGDVGENEFHALASKGPLTVNKATRDRSGWDFLVQGPAENATDTPLDDREVLWTTFIQVKAAWNDRKPSVRVSLAAAEKLAKHRAATFIAILLFDRRSRACTALYMVELTGDRLAMILKALREHQREALKLANDSSIHLHPRPDERLSEISGPAIRERLSKAHRAVSPDGYEAFKTRELKTIGWADDRLRGVITLHDIDQKGLIDVLLGRRAWRASLSGFVERRFEIDLPAMRAPTGEGDIRFSPVPQATSELEVSWKGSGGVLVFSGDHHRVVLPGAKGLESHSRMVFGGFTINHGDGRVRLETGAIDAHAPRMMLADWRRVWRMLDALRCHRTEFRVRSPLFQAPLTWSYPADPAAVTADIGQALMAVEAARDLEEQLDLRLGPILMEEIAPWAKGIVMARHFGMAGRPHFTFTIESRHADDPDYDRSPQDGVYVDFVDLGDKRVAFAVRLRMVCETKHGEDVWSSSRARRLDLRRIDKTPEAFKNFVEGAKMLAGLDKVFLGETDDEFLRQALGEIAAF